MQRAERLRRWLRRSLALRPRRCETPAPAPCRRRPALPLPNLCGNGCAANPGKTDWPRSRPGSCRGRTIASPLQTRLRIGLCRCGPRAARESPKRSPYRLCSLPVNPQRAIRHVAHCQSDESSLIRQEGGSCSRFGQCSRAAAAIPRLEFLSPETPIVRPLALLSNGRFCERAVRKMGSWKFAVNLRRAANQDFFKSRVLRGKFVGCNRVRPAALVVGHRKSQRNHDLRLDQKPSPRRALSKRQELRGNHVL
jgi:hypothetical protein